MPKIRSSFIAPRLVKQIILGVAASSFAGVWESPAQAQLIAQQASNRAINLEAPVAGVQIARGKPVVFSWLATGFESLSVYVYPGIETVDDNPIRVFYQMPPGTVNATIPADEALPPGEYVWSVVGATPSGYVESAVRRFTVTGVTPCGSSDIAGPGKATGIMVPSVSAQENASPSGLLYSRADAEATDWMGRNLSPKSISSANTRAVNLDLPVANAQITQRVALTFAWNDTGFEDLTLLVYPGTEIIDDNPIRVFYQMPPGTINATIPVNEALPPGEYVWTVVGATPSGYVDSEVRRFTIIGATPCGLSDIAGHGQAIGADGFLTADDIIVFLNRFFDGDLGADVAGPGQSPKLDGQLTADDIIVFLNRFFAGC